MISSWHDRRITAGSEFENPIDKNLSEADVILLLVSPDFINSDYCYEREMTRAMERHKNGEARVIPLSCGLATGMNSRLDNCSHTDGW